MDVERSDLPIIEPEIYEKAKEVRAAKSKSFHLTSERESNKYLFSTLIKCKECCQLPNAQKVNEDELIQVLNEYFAEILKNKKDAIQYVTNKLQRVYKTKDENVNYEKELNAQLARLQKTRQKYMDVYTDDLISREELNHKIGGMKKVIEQLENELKMVSYNLAKGQQLENILNSTFRRIEEIADVREMNNLQLKRIIQKIEVDKDENVDIYLRLLGDLGLDETVLICNHQTFRPDCVRPALYSCVAQAGYADIRTAVLTYVAKRGQYRTISYI